MVQTMQRTRTTIIITIMRTIERGTTTAMVTLLEVGGVVAAGVAYIDGSTGDVVSGELVVSGGSSVVVLKMVSGEQVELRL